MRIHEISKKFGIPSKDLIEKLKKGGFQVKNHMSTVSEAAVAYIEKQLIPKPINTSEDQGKKEIMQKERATSKPIHKPVPKHEPKVSHIPSPQKKPVFVQKEPIKIAKKEEEIVPVKIALESMRVSDFAEKTKQPVTDVILTLLRWGVVAPKNFALNEDLIERLAKHYQLEIVKPSKKEAEEQVALSKEGVGELQSRLPIIVVVGHVDHGKTTLLDFIRRTRVAAKEKGGITQHLGAYEATTSHGNLVFIDTPGHAAFPKIRQRGIKVADIGILVVAADDGIMPQTVEAIKQLKAMNVPIIVAINKVDKVDKNRLEVIKRQLAEQDLLPEEWGGQTVCVPISAINGQGIDQLLELVALQAQLMELRAAIDKKGHCFVLESKVEKGRGPVATLICQYGSVTIGDYFICGAITGRVNSLVNSAGKNIDKVGPSQPVQVAGFRELPQVGDLFKVVTKDEQKHIKLPSRDTFIPIIKEEALNLIIKSDTNSSQEAVEDAIEKLSKTTDKGFNIISSSVGKITESDVEFAHSTGARIIGFHTKAESSALALAQRRNVRIQIYDIIYKMLEALEVESVVAKEVEKVRTKVGEAIVRRVFDIKGVGVVAGSYVQDGRFAREGFVVGWRGRQKIGEGKITSLQRDKKSVKEVHAGYECGFVVEGITDWHEDDRAECFLDLPKQ